jgi:DNA-binding response OmpR family regulator
VGIDLMKKKLLIIEGNYHKCMKLNKFFKPYFCVKTANSGLHGLTTAIEWIPSIILVNHLLLDVNSIELCHQFRLKFKTTKILIIGENFTKEQKMNYFQVGADDVYEVPDTYKVLHSKIRGLLDDNSYEDAERVICINLFGR